MPSSNRPLAIVTGASTGIGYELAKCCAENGFDLLVCADEPAIHEAAGAFRQLGASVDAVQADLATLEGVDKLHAAAKGRPVEALLANAGRGLGKGFLDQDFADVRRVVDTNVTGTIYLIQQVARGMVARQQGRILVTGSIDLPRSMGATGAHPDRIDSLAGCLTQLMSLLGSRPTYAVMLARNA